MIHAASATSEGGGDGGGGDGDSGGDQGGADQDGDEGGEETDGSTDFQPDSDTNEETEPTDQTESEEETEPEPTPQLDITPEPSPTPQELVEICDNGQDDDNDGQIDLTDSDCALPDQGITPTPTPTPTPGLLTPSPALGAFQSIAPQKSCRPSGSAPSGQIPGCSPSDRLGACQDIGLVGTICEVLPPNSPTPPPKRPGEQCSVGSIPGSTLPLCINVSGRVADCVNISIGTVCTALSPTQHQPQLQYIPILPYAYSIPTVPTVQKHHLQHQPQPQPHTPTPTQHPLLLLLLLQLQLLPQHQPQLQLQLQQPHLLQPQPLPLLQLS